MSCQLCPFLKKEFNCFAFFAFDNLFLLSKNIFLELSPIITLSLDSFAYCILFAYFPPTLLLYLKAHIEQC